MLSVTRNCDICFLHALPAIPTLLALPSALFSAILRGNMDTKTTSDSVADNATWIVSDDPVHAQAPAASIQDDASGGFQAFSADEHPVLTAMHHLGLPLITFGGCLCLLMIVLMFLFTPDRFPVRIGEQAIALSALTSEQEELRLEESRLLDERRSIGQSVPTPVLHQVRTLSADFVPVGSVLQAVSTVRQSFVINGQDPVRIDSVQVDASARRMTVAGRMIDASRSVEMLASFVDGLRASPLFASVSEPDYSVEHGADGAIFSPFTITLVLAHG